MREQELSLREIHAKMFCLVRLEEDLRRRHLQMGVLVETETRGEEWWSSKKLDTSLTVSAVLCAKVTHCHSKLTPKSHRVKLSMPKYTVPLANRLFQKDI